MSESGAIKPVVLLALSIFALIFEPAVAHGAEMLELADFYKRPAGMYGMEMSESLRAADRQVRTITGYMVQQQRPHAGRFLLSPRPVLMSEHADGEADDLPVALLTVYLDLDQQSWAVPYTRGLISVTGIVEVGRYEESDGRVSWVRMHLPPSATRPMTSMELANLLHSQQHRH